MVHTSCDGLYVFLFIPWVRFSAGCRGTLHFKEQCDVGGGHINIYRYGFPDIRDAFRGTLGQGGMGTLLELGSERDMGAYYLAELYAVYTSSSVRTDFPEDVMPVVDFQLYVSADVLVGSELPSDCIGKRACI